MADIPASYLNADAYGVPAFETFDTLVSAQLLAGSEPSVQAPSRILLASSLDLAQFSVVGIDADGNLALAVTGSVDPADDIAPVGVLAHAASSGAGNTTIYGETFLTGHFNVGDDSPLVFDASFDTVEKKVAATVGNPNLRFSTNLGANPAS